MDLSGMNRHPLTKVIAATLSISLLFFQTPAFSGMTLNEPSSEPMATILVDTPADTTESNSSDGYYGTSQEFLTNESALSAPTELDGSTLDELKAEGVEVLDQLALDVTEIFTRTGDLRDVLSTLPTQGDAETLIMDIYYEYVDIQNLINQAMDPNLNPLMDEDLSFMVSHYLTDPDSWFLVADKGVHSLNFFWREKARFDNSDDFDTGDAKYKAFQRFVAGVSDWKGVFGSQGAG